MVQRDCAAGSDLSLVRDGLLITADFASVDLVWGVLETIMQSSG
jgi:hypothetical protein